MRAVDRGADQALAGGEGAHQVVNQDRVAVPGLAQDAVAEGAGRGEDDELAGPGIAGGQQHHQVLLRHGERDGEVGPGQQVAGERAHPGVLGGRGDDLGVVPGLGGAPRIDSKGAGGDEAQAAARRGEEAPEIAEGGQVAQVERGLDLARRTVGEGHGKRAGVAVHQQVGYRAQAERTQQLAPGRRPLDHAEQHRVAAGVVSGLVRAAGEHRGPPRGDEPLELLHVQVRNLPRREPEQHVDVGRDVGGAVEVDLHHRAVLAQELRELDEAAAGRSGEGEVRLRRGEQGLQMGAHPLLEVGQVGVLDPLDEHLRVVLEAQHQRGPDLLLPVLVPLDAPHADRGDLAARRVPGPGVAAQLGIDDPGVDAVGGFGAKRRQQGADLPFDLLQVRRHALPRRDEQGEGHPAVEPLEEGAGLRGQGGRREPDEVDLGAAGRLEDAAAENRDRQEQEEAEEGLQGEAGHQLST